MRRRIPESVSRGQLVEDAGMAFSLAYYQVDVRERIERTLSVLTDLEHQFVLDLEAGRITEQSASR